MKARQGWADCPAMTAKQRKVDHMNSGATVEINACEKVSAEIERVARTAEQPPELDDIRRRLPQANGDQDTW